jgi:hypothetical protein
MKTFVVSRIAFLPCSKMDFIRSLVSFPRMLDPEGQERNHLAEIKCSRGRASIRGVRTSQPGVIGIHSLLGLNFVN